MVTHVQNQRTWWSRNAIARNWIRRPVNTVVRNSHWGCFEAPARIVTIASGGTPIRDDMKAVSPPEYGRSSNESNQSLAFLTHFANRVWAKRWPTLRDIAANRLRGGL